MGGAFSLIELLVVMAILVILMAFIGPSLPSLLGSKGMGRAITDVSSLLEMAKTEAITRSSYVYVAFASVTNSDNNDELRAAAVISLDGSADNVTSANLEPLSKLVKLENTLLVGPAELPDAVRKLADPDQLEAINYVSNFADLGFSFAVGEQTFSRNMIIFAPSGELLPTLGSRMFRPLTIIGLVASRGGQAQANDGGLVTWLGSASRTETIRP